MPTYVARAALNLGLVTVYHPGVRSHIVRECGLPSLPLELHSGLTAGSTVTVESEDDEIVLEIDDDGVGIDVDEPSGRPSGLAMVRRRLEDVGGVLEIATRADGGTHSRVALPARLG
jgi:signal transduction histidine kinase